MPVELDAADNSSPTPDAAPAEPTNLNDLFSQTLPSGEADAGSAQSATAAGNGDAPQSPASAAPAQPAFRELFKDSGLDLSGFNSDQELVAAILNERRQLSQYAQIGQRFAPQAAEFESFLASKQQAQPGQQPGAQPEADPNAWNADKHFAEQWKVPEWNKSWDWLVKNGHVEIGEDGLFAARQGSEMLVAQHLPAMNEHRQANAEMVQNLFRGNPYQAIHNALLPAIEHQFKTMFEQQFGQVQSQAQQQSEMQKFEQQFSSVLFDQSGNPTQAGIRLGELAQPLIDQGWSEAKAFNWAANAMGLNAQTPAAAAQPALAPTPAQTSGAKVESFIEQAKRNASHQPNSAPYAPTPNSPNQPLISSEVELAQMWDQAAQAAN